MATPSGKRAWRSVPSWYLVAEHDQVLMPEAQQWMAKRIGATITSTPASHAVPLSQPETVAEFIASAAAARP